MSTYDFTDPATSQQWVNLLLQGCYQNRMVLDQAMASVTPTELAQFMSASMSQVLLYQAIVSYWADYKVAPPPNAMAIAVGKLVSQLAVSQEQRQAVLTDMQNIFTMFMCQPLHEAQVALVLSIVKKVYHKARVEPELGQILQDNLQTGNVDDVLSRVTALKGKARTDKVPKNVFSLAKTEALGVEFSSGLAWFDELVGGSMRTGEGYGLIAETGGGKTTMTAHLSCALAAQGKRVLIIVTEQSFQETSLRAKYWATVAKKNWKEFEKYDSLEQVPDELADATVKKQIEMMQPLILGFDLNDVHSITDVRDLVMHHRPDVFMVDWAGTLADRLMADKDNQWKGDRNLCLRAIATEVNNIAKVSGSAGIVYHQLAPSAGKNPFRDYDHTMAAECKTFCWNLSFGVVFAPRDPNNIMRVSCTKSRLGGRKDCLVHLNGPLATLEPVTGYKKGARKGVWVKNSDADFGTLPKEKKAEGPL